MFLDANGHEWVLPENGAKTASVKTLRALARALRVDVDLLMPAEIPG